MKLFDREAPEPEPIPSQPPPLDDLAADSLETEQETQSDAEQERAEEPVMEQKESLAPNPIARKSVESYASASSVIGQTLVVKGELEAAEDMLIEGRIEGTIRHTADRLIVGPSGQVNADVNAKNLIVQGLVEGNIVGTESVTICETANVKGNIYTARISIADGAQFSGTVDMELAGKPKH